VSCTAAPPREERDMKWVCVILVACGVAWVLNRDDPWCRKWKDSSSKRNGNGEGA